MNWRPWLLTLPLLAAGWVGVSAQEAVSPSVAPVAPAPAQPATPVASPSSPSATTPASDTVPPTPHEQAGRCVDGTEYSCLELNRTDEGGKDHRIMIIRAGTSDASGIDVTCQPLDDDPPGSPLVAVFTESGAGGIRIIIDKNLIKVPYAKVSQVQSEGEGSSGDGSLEAGNGTARILETIPEGATDRLGRCGVEVKTENKPGSVQVTQGKTQLRGQTLVYDQSDGMARIEGPITFSRQAEDGELKGTSDSIEVNVDEESTVLVGNVKLTSSGGRVSEAERVEYDDLKNEARLIGTPEHPATSRDPGSAEPLSACLIVYNLESNEAYVHRGDCGMVTGAFDDGEGTTDTGRTAPAPAPTSTQK